MRTTLDLPDILIEQVDRRASSEGRDRSAVAADLLRIGLARESASVNVPAPELTRKTRPVIKIHPLTHLPYVQCAPDAPISRMTSNEFLELMRSLDEEEDLERFASSLRR